MNLWRKVRGLFRVLPENSTPDPAVVQALNEFWPMFQNSRSLCCYLGRKGLGKASFVPAPFYQATTPYLLVRFKQPLSHAVRQAHNRIGGWTNENCLIRLWAILESHGFTKPIRENVNSSDTVKLLKRLRQHFAHGTGLYDKHKPRHRKLRRDLLHAFPVPKPNPREIPLDIDRVLKPMFESCRQYVDEVLRREQAA